MPRLGQVHLGVEMESWIWRIDVKRLSIAMCPVRFVLTVMRDVPCSFLPLCGVVPLFESLRHRAAPPISQ